MHFSISCGLSFMCVTALLFLPEQGKTLEMVCCVSVSTARIREPVKACYEQMEDKFPDCKRYAYILKGNSGRLYCVDPDASWLPQRLQRLKTRGINCTVL
uniref:C-C chemokine 2 n=1 Tax=Epinephelus coioides TaxID=94232 RepID=F2VQR1_EPICO|nr:C-C chemokine 2 [Epinephelus coioides]